MTTTHAGAEPVASVKVTPNETAVPTTAGFGETAGSVSRPVEWPAAVPTTKPRSSSANGDATSTLMGNLPRCLTVTPVMRRRMGGQGGVGNGTAVMAPRTLAPVRRGEGASKPAARSVASHPERTLPHQSARPARNSVRWAQRFQVPSGGAIEHQYGGVVRTDNRSQDLVGDVFRGGCGQKSESRRVTGSACRRPARSVGSPGSASSASDSAPLLRRRRSAAVAHEPLTCHRPALKMRPMDAETTGTQRVNSGRGSRTLYLAPIVIPVVVGLPSFLLAWCNGLNGQPSLEPGGAGAILAFSLFAGLAWVYATSALYALYSGHGTFPSGLSPSVATYL